MKTITTKIPITPQEIVPDSQINPITLILSAVKDRISDVDELKYIGTDWGQLDGYFVSRENTDKVHTQLSTDMS